MSNRELETSPPTDPRPMPVLRRFAQAGLVVAFIAAGFGIMLALEAMKKPPAQREVVTAVRKVRVRTVEPSDHPVVITGHGTARAKYRIPLIPQVSGKVVKVSPQLKAGHRVAKGTVLVEIERDSYVNNLNRARSEVARLEAQIRLLEENLKYDRKRLDVSRRAVKLAEKEFHRVRDLLEDDKVGSLAAVENAERLHLERQRDLIALENSVAAQPIRVAELRAALDGAKAQCDLAQLDLDRTRITAPFDARVESADVQIGQVVGSSAMMMGGGGRIAELTDLGVLEIPIAIENVDLEWLPIREVSDKGEYAFDPRAPVTIRWIQAPKRGAWRGRIRRLERFQTETRTIILVVEAVDNRPQHPKSGRLQLEEGMFCRVEVTGVTARGVYAVPRTLIRQDRTVPVLADGTLELPVVHVVRFQGDLALVDEGLAPGTRLVLTPIADPVPGMKLRAVTQTAPAEDRPTSGSAGS